MNNIRHSKDATLERYNMQYWGFLIKEYNLAKAKKHPSYKFVQDFYKVHGIHRQNFIKYYNRYKPHNDNNALLPLKRGPRYNTRSTPQWIEIKIIALRMLGANRYEIHSMLKEACKVFTPAPSTIYGILSRNNLHRFKLPMKTERRKIIKEKARELVHLDCHQLPKGLIEGSSKRYYLVALIDSCTRVAWAEVVEDIQSLTVIFSVLRMLNLLKLRYGIKIATVLTDNEAKFGSGVHASNKRTHPIERMLQELGIKHVYTPPYRPQTTGKAERFRRTVQAELLEDIVFASMEAFQGELEQYILSYNEFRDHQGLEGETPEEFNKNCHRIT